MRNANSRRGQTSITHLMNFTLPPRPQDYRNTIGRGTRRGNIYGIGSGDHSSDKARLVLLQLAVEAFLIVLGTYMQTIDSLSSPMEITSPKQSMLTSLWTGTMYSRFSHLRFHRKLLVLFASPIPLLLGWQSAVTFSVCLV